MFWSKDRYRANLQMRKSVYTYCMCHAHIGFMSIIKASDKGQHSAFSCQQK